MSLQLDPFKRLTWSLATFAGLALGLTTAPACFKGDDGQPVATETGTATETGPACEVGTDGCPCTGGGVCNPGLECIEGMCEAIIPECGNGEIEGDEQCDDGNLDNTDDCTVLCMPPSCEDGIVSGTEIAADCGIAACGVGCEFGEPCMIDNDCLFPICGPSEDAMVNVCQFPTNCQQYLMFTPDATDGNLLIDPDGVSGSTAPFEVFCHMSKDGGGWTLVMVTSDDGTNTWTWNNRAQLANEVFEVGDLDNLNRDFMSLAYHTVQAADLLFIHQPSDVWAAYNGVGGLGDTMGVIVTNAGSPVCDYNLGGNGFALSAGTLTSSGQLCDTDLYFNLGDHEDNLMACMDFGSSSNTATFGPVWSADAGDGCPFDDPAEYGIGPHGPCGVCPDDYASTEFSSLGYASALNLNMGGSGAGENYLQVYVR